MSQRAPDIHIACARADLETAGQLRQLFMQQGWQVSVNVDAVSPPLQGPEDSDWGVDNSRCVILLWSKNNAVHPRWPLEQWISATTDRLIVLSLDWRPEVPPTVPWFGLNGWNGSPEATGIQRLLLLLRERLSSERLDIDDAQHRVTDDSNAASASPQQRPKSASTAGTTAAKPRFRRLRRLLRWLVGSILVVAAVVAAYVVYLAVLERLAQPAPDIHNLDPQHLAPEMVVVPGGEFLMGSADISGDESPQHTVQIAAFAIGRFEVTFDEYAVFAKATWRPLPADAGWGRGKRPVINVSWDDAQAYTAWLSEKTGKRYRLPTEAEWEYAARAGALTAYWWGDALQKDGKAWANCDGCGSPWDHAKTAPAGAFPANPFGLHDTAGNVWEWVQDCYHDSYKEAPSDGRAWEDKNGCEFGQRVVRGGAWNDGPQFLRSASRLGFRTDGAFNNQGFRLARAL